MGLCGDIDSVGESFIKSDGEEATNMQEFAVSWNANPNTCYDDQDLTDACVSFSTTFSHYCQLLLSQFCLSEITTYLKVKIWARLFKASLA